MRKAFILFLLLVATILSQAQKLPDIQNSKMNVPQGLRIDGRLQEWNNTFAAENKRTELCYSIANDEKNIYLAIKSGSQNAVAKIMAGGISFTINVKGKKKEDDAFKITYPIITRNIGRAAGGQGQNRQRVGQNRSEQTQQQRDSITLVQRKTQLAGIKEIKAFGFKDIPDSLISIYNEYGIKAAATIDDLGAYCYELAIPLAVLEISGIDSKEIAYQIKLNGRPEGGGNFAMRTNAGGGFGAGNARRNFGGGNANAARQDLMSATDFWGKYPLQKK